MKMDIDIPDDLLPQIDAAAERMGMTRHAFVVAAVRRIVERTDAYASAIALREQTVTLKAEIEKAIAVVQGMARPAEQNRSPPMESVHDSVRDEMQRKIKYWR